MRRLTPLSAVILEEPALQQTPRVALCKMLHKMVCLHHKDDRHNEQRDQNKQHRGGQRHHGNQVHAADVSHKERRHHRAEQRPAQRVERQAKLEHQHKPNGKRHNDRKCRDLRVRQIQRPLKQRQKQNAKNHRQGRGKRFLQNVRQKAAAYALVVRLQRQYKRRNTDRNRTDKRQLNRLKRVGSRKKNEQHTQHRRHVQ